MRRTRQQPNLQPQQCQLWCFPRVQREAGLSLPPPHLPLLLLLLILLLSRLAVQVDDSQARP